MVKKRYITKVLEIHAAERRSQCSPGDGSDQSPATVRYRTINKKADATEHLEVFDRVGLLVNEPPGIAELPFS